MIKNKLNNNYKLKTKLYLIFNYFYDKIKMVKYNMDIGILLPIFSLPSKYGIGDLGYEAYEFIDILSKYNDKYWELLNFNDFKQNINIISKWWN